MGDKLFMYMSYAVSVIDQMVQNYHVPRWPTRCCEAEKSPLSAYYLMQACHVNADHLGEYLVQYQISKFRMTRW